MVESVINCREPKEAQVVFLGIGYDQTASFGKGAVHGPEGIRQCLARQIEFRSVISGLDPHRYFKIAFPEPLILNVHEPARMVEIVRAIYEEYFKRGQFVILLGGEHSVSNGAFLAISDVLKSKISGVTILQIDAHLDLRNTDEDYAVEKAYGPYSHSCVMRRAYELGFPIVSVGARSFSDEEFRFAKEKKITVFQWKGSTPWVRTILKTVKTEKVYLTLDIDGLDPSVAPATGTPAPGGLSWYYALDLLQALFRGKTVIGADIMEVAPRANDHLTQFAAAGLAYEMLAWRMEKETRLSAAKWRFLRRKR